MKYLLNVLVFFLAFFVPLESHGEMKIQNPFQMELEINQKLFEISLKALGIHYPEFIGVYNTEELYSRILKRLTYQVQNNPKDYYSFLIFPYDFFGDESECVWKNLKVKIEQKKGLIMEKVIYNASTQKENEEFIEGFAFSLPLE